MGEYSEQQVLKALVTLNVHLEDDQLWVLTEGKLVKTFKFNTFIDAFGWMSKIAICADKLNHHPDWSNSYNKVFVSLTTHELNGLSELDFKLAEKMEYYFK